MSDDRQQNEDQEEGEGPSLPPLPQIKVHQPVPDVKKRRNESRHSKTQRLLRTEKSRINSVRATKNQQRRDKLGITREMLDAIKKCDNPHDASKMIPDSMKAKIVVMLESGILKIRTVGKVTGIPKKVIRLWLSGEIEKRIEERKAIFRVQMMRKLDGIVNQILDSIPEKIEDAPLQVLVTSFGTIFDKIRLLEGAPSQIIENRSIEDRIVSIQQNYASAIKVAMEIEDIVSPPPPVAEKKKFLPWPEEDPQPQPQPQPPQPLLPE